MDGLRGLAAVLVVVYHLKGGRAVVPGGYLAVDLFFTLSGFVVAHAYEERLREGMSLLRFATVRAIRLYPLYIAGCAIGGASALATAAATQDAGLARETFGDLPFALLLLPRVSLAAADWFRLNPPAWSLFYEWTFNLAYAAALPLLTTRRLAGLTAASFAGLVLLCLCYGVAGQGVPEIPLLSLVRPIFGLSAGCVAYRLWAGGLLPRVVVPEVVPVLLLVALTRLPYDGVLSARAFPLAIGVAVPLMLLAGIESTPRPRAAAWMRSAGAMSYPLYALHWPVMEACDRIWPGRSPDLAATLALLGGIALVAWAALRFYDEPVRRALSRPGRSAPLRAGYR